MSEEDRCWICLCSDGEAPPLARLGEPMNLISPCSCSLKAHKRCLVDWASNRDSLARTATGNQNNRSGFHQVTLVPLMVSGFSGVVSLNSKRGWKLYSSDQVSCPQCQSDIFLTMKPSSILSLSNLVRNFARNSAKYVTLTVMGTTFTFALSVSVFSWITSLGVKIFDAIAPQSVQMSLLSLKDRNLDSAIVNGTIGLRHLSIYAGIPVFFYSLRSNNAFLCILGNLYPLLFSENLRFTSLKDLRIWLHLLQPIHKAYEFIYSMTFNRVYYHWTQNTKPFILVDGLSAEELDKIEEENTLYVQLENKRLESLKDLPWYRKIYHWLFPNYSPKEAEIIQLRRSRKWKNILATDFATAFQKKSTLTRILTTLIWPFAGKIIGLGLSQFPFIRSLINKAVNTPDEATYVINILGMCVASVLKEIVKLFIVWCQVREYQSIDVVDSELTGFEIGSMTFFESQTAENGLRDISDLARDILNQAIQAGWNQQDHFSGWDSRITRMALAHMRNLGTV